jgi:hypothetical protein
LAPLLLNQALAGPLTDAEIPAALKPWKAWVLHDQQERLCPLGKEADTRLCVWPSTLHLDLGKAGGQFTLEAHLYAPGWLGLPGDDSIWPQDVSSGGKALPVQDHGGQPAVYLEAGDYRIDGHFLWSHLPESLQTPVDAGLVSLTINGSARPGAPRNAAGQIALDRSEAATAPEGDHLGIKVFREVDDGIPLTLNTHIELEVGGKARAQDLGNVLPAGFLPMTLAAGLPARLGADGKLLVQLRPGLWSLDLLARAPAPLNRIAPPALAAPWPTEEVWSFQSHPDLRVVDVGGGPGVDPQQTQMPDGWRSLPAFLLTPAGSLNLTEKQRGISAGAPDQLTLKRELWLDQSGNGYTLKDQLSGQLKSHWRLDAVAPVSLGQVLVDGQPQLITQQGDTTGVEVRNSNLNLVADSRIEQDLRRLPVSGWNTELQTVKLQLHLPPAWRLLAAPGTDNVPSSWVSRWTLLDLFVVLITSVAALRLFGPAVGGLTLLTLVLTWQEPDAPRWLWVHLITAVALVRALPASLRDSRLLVWLERYRWLAALVLVMASVPFAVHQVRCALYPQLEGTATMETLEMPAAAADEPATPAPEAMDAPEAKAVGGLMSSPVVAASNMATRSLSKAGVAADRLDKLARQQLDPTVITQTGPGLPQWTGNTVALNWSGAITPDQQFRLWLQPPWLTRLLEVLGIVLMGALLAAWLDLRPGHKGGGDSLRRLLGGLLPLLVLALLFTPAPARADDAPDAPDEPAASAPAASILDTLRERLLAAPACLPDCVQIPRLHVSVSAGRLDLRLSVDAASAAGVALPLPPQNDDGSAHVWQADTVLLDGKPAALRRNTDGSLWASVGAGHHEVLVSGPLQGFSQLQLPLPLKPHLVQADTGAWTLSGVDEQGVPDDTLQLSAAAAKADAGSAAAGDETVALNPLLRVTRTISMDQDWDVDTQVERIGASGDAALLSIPLLPGEAVTGDDIRVLNQRVQASFAPGQTSFSWHSRLPAGTGLTLSASRDPSLYEVWQFRVSPRWHVALSGLPPVQNLQGSLWQPGFQPWPGETLQVAVSHPIGAKGSSLTLDRADLSLQPTSRATDSALSLHLRSSQGGQQALHLPAGTTVNSLSIDGNPVTPRLENGELVLPLHPGEQQVQLTLHNSEGLRLLQQTPALDLGLPGVNANITVQLPENRWVLLVGGPRQGPAVLFWGLLLVMLGLAWGLGGVALTPLRRRDWLLLMTGLSQLPVYGAAIVVLWLLALGARGRLPVGLSWLRFNLLQVMLVLLSLVALGLLGGAVARGLLGSPDMQVTGNNSGALELHWFQDRFAAALPGAWVLNVSIWFYRLLMLLWALWLANALLGWLRWGWEQATVQGLWQRKPILVMPPRPPAPGKTGAPPPP